jgi:hypothetical protein
MIGAKLLERVEGLVDQGTTLASILAPEAIPNWARAKLLVRVLRAEVIEPGSAVKAAAHAMGFRRSNPDGR